MKKFISQEDLAKDVEWHVEVLGYVEILKRMNTLIRVGIKRKLMFEILGEVGCQAYDNAGGSMMTMESLIRSMDTDTLKLFIANIKCRWNEILAINEMIKTVDDIDSGCE